MALGHACQGGPLPLNEGDKTGDGGEGEELSKMELIKQLKKLLQSSKETKVRIHVYLCSNGPPSCSSQRCENTVR